MTLNQASVVENISLIRSRIKGSAGGRPVSLVVVTKGFGVEAVRAALAVGELELGENYAQELIAKHAELTDDERSFVQWHFLGRLQSKKIRALAPIVAVWQSIDRLTLIDELARRAPGARIFIQANLSGEEQKGGAALSEVPMLVDHAQTAGLDVRGLMGVGAAGDAERSVAGFEALVALSDQLGLSERSVGMTEDLELAVSAGSTMVRVGSAIFGPRSAPLRG